MLNCCRKKHLTGKHYTFVKVLFHIALLLNVVSLLAIACENIRFSSLFAAAKSEEKRMFSQAILARTFLASSHIYSE